MSIATATAPITPRTSIDRGLRRHRRLLAALDRSIARHGLAVWDDDGLSKSMSHQPAPVRRAADAAAASAHDLILDLIALHRPELPSWARWHLGLAPIVQHRAGSLLLLVVPGDSPATLPNGGSEPMDVEDAANFARLVVVDLDA